MELFPYCTSAHFIETTHFYGAIKAQYLEIKRFLFGRLFTLAADETKHLHSVCI